jgi:hypothetical protein
MPAKLASSEQSIPTKMKPFGFRLEVTQRKNGTFDHKVVDAAGKVLATRNSVRRYRAAAIARTRIAVSLRNARELVTCHQRQLDEYRQVVASGVVPAAFRTLTVDDYRGFVTNAELSIPREQARVVELEGMMSRLEHFPPYVAGFSGTYAGAAKLVRGECSELLGVATE